eukprot:6481570-Amphidinium_carterae.2
MGVYLRPLVCPVSPLGSNIPALMPGALLVTRPTLLCVAVSVGLLIVPDVHVYYLATLSGLMLSFAELLGVVFFIAAGCLHWGRLGCCCLGSKSLPGFRSLSSSIMGRCVRIRVKVLPGPVGFRIPVDIVLLRSCAGMQVVTVGQRVFLDKPKLGVQLGRPCLPLRLLRSCLLSIHVGINEDGVRGAADLHHDSGLRGWQRRPDEPNCCLSEGLQPFGGRYGPGPEIPAVWGPRVLRNGPGSSDQPGVVWYQLQTGQGFGKGTRPVLEPQHVEASKLFLGRVNEKSAMMRMAEEFLQMGRFKERFHRHIGYAAQQGTQLAFPFHHWPKSEVTSERRGHVGS